MNARKPSSEVVPEPIIKEMTPASNKAIAPHFPNLPFIPKNEEGLSRHLKIRCFIMPKIHF